MLLQGNLRRFQARIGCEYLKGVEAAFAKALSTVAAMAAMADKAAVKGRRSRQRKPKVKGQGSGFRRGYGVEEIWDYSSSYKGRSKNATTDSPPGGKRL